MFAGQALPINSGNTTPREERAASSKDVPVAVVEQPSLENLFVKALQSMLNKGDEDRRPNTKERRSSSWTFQPQKLTDRGGSPLARPSAQPRTGLMKPLLGFKMCTPRIRRWLSDPRKFLALDTKLLSAISKVVKA